MEMKKQTLRTDRWHGEDVNMMEQNNNTIFADSCRAQRGSGEVVKARRRKH